MRTWDEMDFLHDFFCTTVMQRVDGRSYAWNNCFFYDIYMLIVSVLLSSVWRGGFICFVVILAKMNSYMMQLSVTDFAASLS